eukprot:Skav207842  [mRNA]  locus=scaffold3025:200490:206215:+ [translate_table: standard]
MMAAGKGVDIHKAVTATWTQLMQKGLVDPEKFISTTPHMTFAHGEEQIAWLKKRFAALKDHPLFQGMEYTDEPKQMKEWAPLMMEGRGIEERCALTRVPYGTDVDFGELTKELIKAFVSLGGDVQLMTNVCRGTAETVGFLLKSTGTLLAQENHQKFIDGLILVD